MGDPAGADGGSNNAALFASKDAVELYRERIEDSRLFPEERKVVERYLGDGEGTVLDIGCGVGRVSHLLDDRGFDVTGIDVSEPLIEEARSRFPEIEFHVCDIRDAPFDAGTFDYVVFSFYGLDYVLPKAERVRALREIYRLLKPSGILTFSSHNGWHPFVPIPLESLGRAVSDIRDLYLRGKNRDRLLSRYKHERVPLGEVEIYVSNPIHAWLQLRKCGFTPINVVGEHEGLTRFFERGPYYVAKK